MADNMIGGGGGGINSVLQGLLQNAENNQAQQNATQSADDAAHDSLQERLAKQAMLKQQQVKDHISHDHSHQALRKEAFDKRLGPGVADWAGAEALQKKLTAKQKELFIKQAQAGDPKANDAGSGLAKLSASPNFDRAVPTSAAAANLQATVMKRPAVAQAMHQAINSPFMGDKKADAGAMAGFMRFAARGEGMGVSIKMGGDMLGALSGARVPGFAQRSAMSMIDRDPNNVRGTSNLQDFVEAPPMRALPRLALGRATEVLANGDGSDELKESLEGVAGSKGFRGLPQASKAELFATIGQGRASELRAITDQTLMALRSANFPSQGAQVSRFLGGLSKKISEGGAGKDIDAKALVRKARRGTMPSLPKLLSTVDSDDEEAQAKARSHNRAALMRYYSQVGEHYEGIEGQIKNAKYFEDVNLLTGLKPAKMPALEGILKVSDGVRASVEAEMNVLNDALASHDLTRPAYQDAVRALQAKALGRSDLTVDEKTWMGAITNDAYNAQVHLDLMGKKNRKMREVGKNLMPAAKRRRLSQQRRTVTAQPRYFRLDDSAAGSVTSLRATPMPLPGRETPSLGSGPQGAQGPLDANLKAQLGQLVTGLQALLSGADSQGLGRTLNQLAKSVQQTTGASKREAPTKPAMSGKTDGWGIPRTFERDLGATAHVTPVRAPQASAGVDEASSDGPLDRETPRSAAAHVSVVRPTAQLRDLATLYDLPWKQLSKDESNIFRNLGWSHAIWDAKGQPGARLPVSLRTPFSGLSPKERSSVQALGFSQDDWDHYVHGLASK